MLFYQKKNMLLLQSLKRNRSTSDTVDLEILDF